MIAKLTFLLTFLFSFVFSAVDPVCQSNALQNYQAVITQYQAALAAQGQALSGWGTNAAYAPVAYQQSLSQWNVQADKYNTLMNNAAITLQNNIQNCPGYWWR